MNSLNSFVAVVLCGLLSGVPLAAQLPIRVYIAPVVSPSGFTDATLKRRTDSRNDLLRELRDKRITIVDTADGADLTLEVLSSAYTETGDTSSTTVRRPDGTVGTRSDVVEEARVRVRLTAGNYTLDVTGVPKESLMMGSLGGAWGRAAKDAADQIKRWVRDNEPQLLGRRPK